MVGGAELSVGRGMSELLDASDVLCLVRGTQAHCQRPCREAHLQSIDSSLCSGYPNDRHPL